jgi:SAM-dependent methyltransferase
VTSPPETQGVALACAWCGAGLRPDAGDLAGRVACRSCGVATTYPWPTEAELDAAYAGAYRPDGGRFSGPGDALLRRSRAALARRIDRLAPAGPVLDVGAGEGALLDALAARGREVVGLEREPSHPRMRDAEVWELDGPWAAVVFWHSLEHLREPGRALDEAARRLAPGGLLVAALPNAASLQARAFGERWFALDLPRHLVHVPAAALLDRAGAAGLSVERVSHLRGGQVAFGWLHGIVGRLPGHPDLYDAIRRAPARQRPMSSAKRAATLAAAALAAPVAAGAALLEAAARRGGSVYLEARRG